MVKRFVITHAHHTYASQVRINTRLTFLIGSTLILFFSQQNFGKVDLKKEGFLVDTKVLSFVPGTHKAETIAQVCVCLLSCVFLFFLNLHLFFSQ